MVYPASMVYPVSMVYSASMVYPVSRVQELCASRGGRPGLPVLMSLTVPVYVKQHCTMLRHWSQFLLNMSTDTRGHEALHHHHHPVSELFLKTRQSLSPLDHAVACRRLDCGLLIGE